MREDLRFIGEQDQDLDLRAGCERQIVQDQLAARTDGCSGTMRLHILSI